MSPLWRALFAALRVLPERLFSAGVGWTARRRLPAGLQGRLNRGFARRFRVDLSEAEKPAAAYPSLAAFFSRGLRGGARNWAGRPGWVASPADGVLQSFGTLTEGVALQAKGLSYGVAELLGGGSEAEWFRRGVFLTVYLSPRHYHRVHGPCPARLRAARRIRGRLLPVRPSAARQLPRLYVGNERVVTLLETEAAHIAVVAIGALNVGSISTDFDPSWKRGSPGWKGGARSYDPALALEAGDPLLTFHLGSTVVLFVSRKDGAVPAFCRVLGEGRELRVGDPVVELERPGTSSYRGRPTPSEIL